MTPLQRLVIPEYIWLQQRILILPFILLLSLCHVGYFTIRWCDHDSKWSNVYFWYLTWPENIGPSQQRSGIGAFIWGMEICSQALDPMDRYHNILITYKQHRRWRLFSSQGFTAYTVQAASFQETVYGKVFLKRNLHGRWVSKEKEDHHGNEKPWNMLVNLAKHTVFHSSFSATLLSFYEVLVWLLWNNSYASGLSFHVFSHKCLADTITTNALKIFVVSGGGIQSKFQECPKEFPPNTVKWGLVLQIQMVLTSETQLSLSVPLMTGPALYSDLVLKSPGCWRHLPFLSSMERICPGDTGEPLPLIGLPNDYTFTYFFIAQWLHCDCLCYCD